MGLHATFWAVFAISCALLGVGWLIGRSMPRAGGIVMTAGRALISLVGAVLSGVLIVAALAHPDVLRVALAVFLCIPLIWFAVEAAIFIWVLVTGGVESPESS